MPPCQPPRGGLGQVAPRPLAADLADVLLVLEDDAEGLVDELRRELAGTERQERRGPVERLGDARHLGQVGVAEPVDEADDLAGEPLGRLGDLGQDDLVFLLGRRVVDPVVEAAALERVVDLARPVRGQDHPRRGLGLDRADLGDRDLEVRQDLEQVRLELLVGAVDLVDEQHRRDAVGRLERLEERPADEEVGAEDVVGGRLLGLAARLEQPDLEHLARVVPLVDRGVDVETLVALQPDQPRAERGGQDLGQLGLADAGLALEQQRAAELERQEDRRRDGAIGDVVAAPEVVLDGLDGAGALGARFAVGTIGHRRNLHGLARLTRARGWAARTRQTANSRRLRSHEQGATLDSNLAPRGPRES